MATDMIPVASGVDDMEIFSEKDAGKIYNKENIDEKNSDEQTLIGDEVEAPKPGMIFHSEEEVRNYYNSYASSQGFGIAKISTKSAYDGKSRYFSLACSRNGKTVSTAKDSYNPRASNKTNCKAKINVTSKEDGRFIITRVYLDHNHALSPGKVRHSRCKKVSDSHAKQRPEFNDLAGVTRSKNFHSLVVESRGCENLPLWEKGCRNHTSQVRKLRLGLGDVEALHRYFYHMQRRNSNFFYLTDKDEDCQIKNVFWADARCRAAFECFGDVISFDTTYLTNNYDMPLTSFIGVNHHGQSILYGCGLLYCEDVDSYIWLFKSFLACMLGRSPKAIVTDQCKAIQAAVAEVFPNALHRFCLCHIMRKIPVRLGGLADYKAIKKDLENVVYNSFKIDEFEEDWLRIIKDYNLENNEWLNSLYAAREHWALVFVKSSFWAGISTTEQSECLIGFFDEYVHSKTTVMQFLEQYDYALKSKMEKESNADFASFNSTIPLLTGLPLEKQFQKVYTNDIFKTFQEELRGLMFCNAAFFKEEESGVTYKVTESVLGKDGLSWKEVVYEVYFNATEFEVQCLCHLFEFKGILCRHIISVLIKNRVNEISTQYLLERWRKDVMRGYTLLKNIYCDFEDNEQGQRNIKLTPLLYEVQKLGVASDKKCELLVTLLGEVKSKLLSCEASPADRLLVMPTSMQWESDLDRVPSSSDGPDDEKRDEKGVSRQTKRTN
ncbi:hypothetical protein NMG60_11032882 [Bertholletia excelsa]